jgi:hypothetical protein
MHVRTYTHIHIQARWRELAFGSLFYKQLFWFQCWLLQSQHQSSFKFDTNQKLHSWNCHLAYYVWTTAVYLTCSHYRVKTNSNTLQFYLFLHGKIYIWATYECPKKVQSRHRLPKNNILKWENNFNVSHFWYHV